MIEGRNEPDDDADGDVTEKTLPRPTKGAPAAGDPLIGTVIHDRFRIIAPIARGGMGAVYKAEQAPLGRLVAIKVLRPKSDEEKGPEFRKRFFLEAATVAKLSHPNTVTVFDYGQSEGLFFIVMELLDGVTLRKALRSDGAFDPARAIYVCKQICRSLREAHRLGVIHRDMKPSNVMLLTQGDEKDYVKVLDFGLVKAIDKVEGDEDLTQAGVFMGSPKYMSPEQIQGELVDGRCDIYSVGVLLYEMLTGKPPFVGDKQVQVLMDHINAPVPPMQAPEGREPLAPELSDIVMKCLAKRREERFADMDELLGALKVAAGDVSMSGSAELGLADVRLGGTPVSGVHAVSSGGFGTRSSGSIPAPGPASNSGPLPGASTIGSSVLTTTKSQSFADETPGNKMVMVLGALALLGAAAIIYAVIDPFRGTELADQPTDEPRGATQARPGPVQEPVQEPVEEPAAEPEPVNIASVLVELESRPSGAMVAIADQSYGPTPAQVELTGPSAAPGTELTFVFTMDGYRATTVTRVAPEDGRLGVNARMHRVRRPSGPPETPEQAITLPGYRDTPY